MRAKSESRRQAILDVAAVVFQEMGERASMEEIAARVGGSKATLYSYFSSKEEILLETIRRSVDRDARKIYEALDLALGDIEPALQAFGRDYLRLVTSPELVAMRRLACSSAGHSDLGRFFYERGPKKGADALTAFLERAARKRQLKISDARTAARHLQGLLESSNLEECLLGVEGRLTDEPLASAVKAAVRVFLAAYGAGRPAP